jgi:hypothetical protein
MDITSTAQNGAQLAVLRVQHGVFRGYSRWSYPIMVYGREKNLFEKFSDMIDGKPTLSEDFSFSGPYALVASTWSQPGDLDHKVKLTVDESDFDAFRPTPDAFFRMGRSRGSNSAGSTLRIRSQSAPDSRDLMGRTAPRSRESFESLGCCFRVFRLISFLSFTHAPGHRKDAAGGTGAAHGPIVWRGPLCPLVVGSATVVSRPVADNYSNRSAFESYI